MRSKPEFVKSGNWSALAYKSDGRQLTTQGRRQTHDRVIPEPDIPSHSAVAPARPSRSSRRERIQRADCGAYGVPDTTSARGVSDSVGLMLCPRIDCAGRSGANENVTGFSS
jgi:hypothetical protein